MISIIIPCFNHNDILPRAVNSVIGSDSEIIIVDDGSTTPISNVWGDSVKLVRHRRNKGLSAALNTGIKHSTCDRFVILASDDELHTSYVPIMSTTYSEDVDIISCDMFTGKRHVRAKPGSVDALMRANCHSYAALVKKALWKKIGGFKDSMNPSWEDWEFWLNAAKNGATWSHVPMPLHVYHRNPTGRDAFAQGKDTLLRAKMQGYHQDLYGKGKGVVSFIIPCYAHEDFVGDAILSVFSQVYPHVNVVVVDDGSPGDVISAVKEVDDGSGRVSIVRQRNKHLSSARNTGVAKALQKHNSQYLVMLDADDMVCPDFLEKTFSSFEHNSYVYTDIRFIGDASHEYEVKDYDCAALTKRHLHACTFLMESNMYNAIVEQRGFGYDEGMKEGYEDWEFAVAAVEAKYCGIRVPEPLFFYRYHNSGSMRIKAGKVSKELGNYIRHKHPWMKSKESTTVACNTCGGRRRTRLIKTNNGNRGGFIMFVQGIGEIHGDEPLDVLYNGAHQNTTTKVGVAGTIYKYSGNPHGTFPPKFTIFAKDAHLFNGPYEINRIAKPEPVKQPVPVAAPVAPPSPVIPVKKEKKAKKEKEIVAEIAEKLEVTSVDPDDLTAIKYVGKAAAKKLNEAGFTYFEDIVDATTDELALVLSVNKARAKQIQKSADAVLEELS